MRQTLFYIPDHLGAWPMFGLGILLAAFGVFSVLLMVWLVRRQGWNDETRSYLPILLVIGAGIAFLGPLLIVQNVGLPIRGYGVFVMLGLVSGVGLSAWQARRMGLDPEVIFSLAGCMCVGGFLGARTFYVIQYWDQFQRSRLWDTLVAVANFTNGGLVVYGSVIGGLVAWLAYCRLRSLPALAIGDLIAPGMLLGLACGRVGCLLNGCCYGGLCEDRGLPAITFPRFADERAGKVSDPYQHQQMLGLLHGFRLGHDAGGRAIASDVRPNSPAGKSGLQVGDVIQRIDLDPVAAMFAARYLPDLTGLELEIETTAGKLIAVPIVPSRGTPAEKHSPNFVGFDVEIRPEQGLVVKGVEPASAAARAGLKAGDSLDAIHLPVVPSMEVAHRILAYADKTIVLETSDGARHDASLLQFPERSRPVHPSQIYSTIKASLLAFFLWSYYPFRRRDGEVFAFMLTLYPLFRILLEVIRDDVPGLYGTPITISQAVSGVVFLSGLGLWLYLWRQPTGSVLPPAAE